MVSKKDGGLPGLLKGMVTTARTAFRPTHTAEYPDVAPDLPPRSRGVIALLEENCTSCMLCARECPDWCIYIDSHKETIPATTEGGRDRQRNVLDRFAIDFSLCMYCGICIEACPFDALHWSPQFEYAEVDILDLLHEKDRLGGWMASVPPPPALDEKSAEPAEIAAANKPARGTGLVGGAGPGAAGAGGPGARMPRTVRPRPAGAGPARAAAAPAEAPPAGEPAGEATQALPAAVPEAPPAGEPTQALPAAVPEAPPAGEPTQALPAGDPTEALPAGDPTAAPSPGEPTELLPTGTVPPPAREPLTGTPESVPDDTSPTPPPVDDAP
jgi:NADH-quinone oxidoreductase subunit I